MKHWLAAALAACMLYTPLTAQTRTDDAEIVIEMHGEQTAPRSSVSIWDKNGRQLTRAFRGKDRTYVLYQVENVSSRDDILRSEDGKEYAYVRYGRDDGDYRKFLFKAESPQTFLACAADAADVLAVNKKYKVNMGLNRADFLRRYEQDAVLTNLADNASGKTYQAYKVNYSDVNNKKPSPHYFVFEEDALVQTYAGDDAFYDFVNQLSDNNKNLTARQQAAAKARQEQLQKERQAAQQRASRPVRKALVSGGTATDQAYMPRAVNATPLPALTPSKLPAGTPLP